MMKLLALLSLSLLTFTASHAHQHEGEFSYAKSDVTDSIAMLSGAGGNIAVLKGADSLLIVDNGFDKNSDALKQALESFGMPTQYVLNTHWHGDHTGGNAALGAHATILAHDNVRVRMAKGVKTANRTIPPAKSVALPDITYAKKTSLHFEHQTVTAVHLPKGHTDGDTIVFFNPANVVHMGDMLFAGYFPFIDANSGGSVAGYMQNLETIIGMMDEKTIVIPGHGKVTNVEGVKQSLSMIKQTSKTISQMKADGLSLEQAQAKGVGEEWQGWGDFFIDEARWVSILWAEVD